MESSIQNPAYRLTIFFFIFAIAFGNEIARMISLCSIIESNSYLRFPKSKQMKSWFTFGGLEGNGQLVPPLIPHSKQIKSWFAPGTLI